MVVGTVRARDPDRDGVGVRAGLRLRLVGDRVQDLFDGQLPVRLQVRAAADSAPEHAARLIGQERACLGPPGVDAKHVTHGRHYFPNSTED